ncbi:MAG: hypothetical protein HKN43_00760 [Rhodothermales bacterium]|nr:hypothetical protein [Rhodothermales bacterium]
MAILVAAMLLLPTRVSAQEERDDWPWTTITTRDSIRFSYLFYSEADSENNGVVLKLSNGGAVHRRYSFTVVFRSTEGVEATDNVNGTIDPRSAKTGDNDGLFWIPFEDGSEISEVGLRRIRISALSGT